MAQKTDGTEVPRANALQLWADAAYEKLEEVAGHYNDVIAYKDLALHVQAVTGVSTTQLIMNWIGPVLELVARRATDAEEPPLTSLCVHADGTIGIGYERAPKFAPPESLKDVEALAAAHRLLCYRRYAADLPADGGSPTLTPQVSIRRRASDELGANGEWLDALIEKGHLSVNDRVTFSTHVEVAGLFGKQYKGHQAATIRLDPTTEVWFPKLYKNGDWDNSLSDDGGVITMQHVPGGNYGSVMQAAEVRRTVVTFGHIKPKSGPRYYAFLGVFEGDPIASSPTTWIHRQVADAIAFDGIGGLHFELRGARVLHDDQVAEFSDADPALVIEYEARLTSGQYFVDDEVGATRVRGSAQRVFAKAVKESYGWECAVTGIKTPAFLVASHIVPWSVDKNIRIDPSNGICLSTFVDRAFDAGFLEIRSNGRTAVRWERVRDDPILKTELSKIDDVEIAKPQANPPDPTKLIRRIELGF
ncbi:HNH endonuclease [Microcella alkaliphila]|uniref:HNH endonuclease n=1 Tax=Microcella alkaliphila TaxID=279828 RepID=A0A0U5BN80_9MICO|nr:HNH endonuclease [Microcella alkaliphila]BAU31654.1 uncharacterized protein MalAC0309_0787 [Microcella alkaliphila]